MLDGVRGIPKVRNSERTIRAVLRESGTMNSTGAICTKGSQLLCLMCRIRATIAVARADILPVDWTTFESVLYTQWTHHPCHCPCRLLGVPATVIRTGRYQVHQRHSSPDSNPIFLTVFPGLFLVLAITAMRITELQRPVLVQRRVDA